MLRIKLDSPSKITHTWLRRIGGVIRTELSILDTMERNNPKYRMDIGYLSDVPVFHPFAETSKWNSGREHKRENDCLFGPREVDGKESERNSLLRGAEERVMGGQESDWWGK